ncbi:MAG: C1 family peptidase, partial [Polyangiaceae bacterium]
TQAITRESLWQYDQVRACKLDRAANDFCSRSIGVREGTWRDDPQLVREVEAADAHPFYSFTEPKYLETTGEIAASLAADRVVDVGIYIDREVWAWNAVKAGELRDYTGGKGSPRHAVAIVGYQPSHAGGRRFKIKNSWGKGWGQGGYVWIREETLQRNLIDAFTFEVRDPYGRELPQGYEIGNWREHPLPQGDPEPPAPAPQTNACQAGLARDLVFGVCLPACAGGKPSLGGLCAPQAPTASSACGAGQGHDPLSGQCVNRCPSGLLPVGGVCWLG